MENVSEEIVSAVATEQLIHAKSKLRYENFYLMFEKWKKIVKTISEEIIFAYMEEKAKTVKASNLRSTYSMMRSTHLINDNINISKFQR